MPPALRFSPKKKQKTVTPEPHWIEGFSLWRATQELKPYRLAYIEHGVFSRIKGLDDAEMSLLVDYLVWGGNLVGWARGQDALDAAYAAAVDAVIQISAENEANEDNKVKHPAKITRLLTELSSTMEKVLQWADETYPNAQDKLKEVFGMSDEEACAAAAEVFAGRFVLHKACPAAIALAQYVAWNTNGKPALQGAWQWIDAAYFANAEDELIKCAWAAPPDGMDGPVPEA